MSDTQLQEKPSCHFVLKPATDVPAYSRGSNLLRTIHLYEGKEVMLGRNQTTGLEDLTQEEDPHILFVSRRQLSVVAKENSVYITPRGRQENIVWLNGKSCGPNK